MFYLIKPKVQSALLLCILSIGLVLITSCEKDNELINVEPENTVTEVQSRYNLYLDVNQIDQTDECCVYIITLIYNTDFSFLELISGNPNVSISLLPGAILDPLRWKVEYCPNEEIVNDTSTGNPFSTVPLTTFDIALTSNGNYVMTEFNLECDLTLTPCPIIEFDTRTYFDEDQPEFFDCFAANFQIVGTPPVGCHFELRVGPRGGVKGNGQGNGRARICPGDLIEVLLVCGEGETETICEYIEE